MSFWCIYTKLVNRYYNDLIFNNKSGSDGKMYLIGLGATKMLKLKIVNTFWHFLKASEKKTNK